MEGLKRTFFEENLFNCMLNSSNQMLEILSSLNDCLDPIIKNNQSIAMQIHSIPKEELKEKANKYYERSILEIQTTARFYTDLSSVNPYCFFNNKLKDLKVNQIIEMGISIEKVIESYKKLSEGSLVKKSLAPMMRDYFKVSQVLEKLLTILRPVLCNDKTIEESIARLKEEQFKKNVYKLCNDYDEVIRKSLGSYSYIDADIYKSFKEIAEERKEKINYNTLNQWKATLVFQQEEIKSEKNELLTEKSNVKKSVLSDLTEIYSVYNDLDSQNPKRIKEDYIRELSVKTKEMLKRMEEKYKDLEVDFFNSKDYEYVVTCLKQMNDCLEKILSFPFKKGIFKSNKNRNQVSLIQKLKSLSAEFTLNLSQGLEINEHKTEKKKVSRFSQFIRKFIKSKPEEKKESVNQELDSNKESQLDEHIHNYRKENQIEELVSSSFTKIRKTYVCDCGKRVCFDEIQMNDSLLKISENQRINGNDFRNQPFNIVSLEQFVPYLEEKARRL